MSASVPNCPDFSREGNHEFEGSMTSNFGCAVNSNLAAMVARPQDLVRGQPGAPSVDPATATKAIQRSEEHTSELQSLMRISYAVFCLKKQRQLVDCRLRRTQIERSHNS